MKMKKNYFIGLDIGTDSVGYAATYEDYTLVKYKGEPVWGAQVFEAAKLRAERRTFRSARRRLNRRKQRVALIRDIFAKEISKVDPKFYLRIRQSALLREDKDDPEKFNVFFNDDNYSDKDFYTQYPTIHHLICELMNGGEHDVRLVYIACAWLVAHRGHFLSEVSKDNIADILNFGPIYERFVDCFVGGDVLPPWECDDKVFSEIMKKKLTVTAKEKEFAALLFDGKMPKDTPEGEYPYNRKLIIKLLSGGTVKADALFFKPQYGELPSFGMNMADEDFAAFLAEIEEDAELVLAIKAMYDWSVLSDVLDGEECISRAKIKAYERHKSDLRNLKSFVKACCPEKYNDIFRTVSSGLDNYSAYSGHIKDNKAQGHTVSRDKFYDFLKKTLKNVEYDDKYALFYEDMTNRIALGTFLPKQVNGDNRVIPHQLYWHELNTILTRAQEYLPFIAEADSDGITNKRKILSVFEYRIPYFVGPLVDGDKSEFAWMKRKADGMIYPWNIQQKVDFDASEQEFIKRMTNTCTYIPGEYVLPKNSLLYNKYEILNTINNIRINGQPIDVETKQGIYSELAMRSARISPKKLKDYLMSVGMMTKDDIIGGVDTQLSVIISSKPNVDFRNLLDGKLLGTAQAEKIITRITCTEDRFRLKKWLDGEFADLPENERKYLCTLKYNDFGRLSEKFLCGINGVCKETGEVGTIMDFLWNTNDNLMQLLSDRYTFREQTEQIKKEYYDANAYTIGEMMDDMYISNSVKRPIFRTLDIVSEITAAMGYAPKKIFVEMARGADESQKNTRTKTRKQQISELYSKINTEEVRLLSAQLSELGAAADNKLQSDVLFLYFMQLGRCMYSGQPLDINQLKTSLYNIDHIYPQCYVKDDSLLNNKVLVLSTYNDEKKDKYPINSEWQSKMGGFWSMLRKNGQITEEKYKRLTRTAPFTDDEKYGFINRQLVETQQSTKAIKNILEKKYADTEIVCVRAGLVSDFRHKYDMKKTRAVNDLHHAKDAYLNIAVGNVYHERFTKKWFKISDTYSMNTHVIFGKELKHGDDVIWKGQQSIALVTKIMRKNNIHFTRYAFCRKGGLFDQNPVKAAEGLAPRKAGMNPEKYGGYNKTAATYFALALYSTGKKKELTFVPIELMYSNRFEHDDEFAHQYVKSAIKSIHNKDAVNLSFPLGKRIIKINTVISLDGYAVAVTGKGTGGKVIGITTLVPLVVPYETEKYIKALERFAQKRQTNPDIVINTEYDGISAEKNIRLYRLFADKLSSKPFSLMPNCQYKAVVDGAERFEKMTTEKQAAMLLNILLLFKTCRAGAVDLSEIGASKNAGVLALSANVSNWKKNYRDVRIIDISASGMHAKQSENLLELI